MIKQAESAGFLECPMCCNNFTIDGPHQPKILKCGHTFCANCVSAISGTEIYQIKCLLCYVITPIGELGISGLPVNRTLVDILRNLSLLKISKDPYCCYCNNKQAKKICFGCDPLGCKLCEQCCIAEHNRRFAPVRSHTPLNIDEVTINIPKIFCGKHEELLTHYSEKHAIFACIKCLEEQFNEDNVDFLPIDLSVKNSRKKLPQVSDNLETYLRKLQDVKYEVEKTHIRLGETMSEVIQKILSKFSEYQHTLQVRQKTLMRNLENEVHDRKKCLGSQSKKLQEITEKIISYKEDLQYLMEKDRQDFILEYWDMLKKLNELLCNDNFSLQQPIATSDMCVYTSDKFDNELHNLGSVGGGPVVNLETAVNTRGLLQIKWNLTNHSENVKQFEIEYKAILPLTIKQDNVATDLCDGDALSHFVNTVCPGWSYLFRIRSSSLSGWGMWSKPIIGQFNDFPCSIGFVAKIVTIKIPYTAHYRITAEGAKAADSDHFKGGRGAIISATFVLHEGDLLEILCGGMSEHQGCHSGGAGGTFVAVNNRQLEGILLVAGGGGGTRGYDDQGGDGCDASLEPSGTFANTIHCAEGGLNGGYGKDANFLGLCWGHGGAGWQQSSTTAKSFVEGGNGGECGGFGGGGGVGLHGGGGGGGFSGGGGGRGGGGGSYVRSDGEDVSKEVGSMGHGQVKIVKLTNTDSTNSFSPPKLADNASSDSSTSAKQ